MIDWDQIGDDEMRTDVLQQLERKRTQYMDQAQRQDDIPAGLSVRSRREAESCARYSRRQAAHYQQAIDLLKAAPMPASEKQDAKDGAA